MSRSIINAADMEQFLSRIELFKPLTPAQRRALAVVAREVRYAKGQTIFREGDPAEAVCLVKTGRVHLMKFLGGGQASTTCVMTPGGSFCLCGRLLRRSCLGAQKNPLGSRRDAS